jgi:autotransporter-associated beta strand protein
MVAVGALMLGVRSAAGVNFTWTGASNNNWSTLPTDLNWTTAWTNNANRSAPNTATFDLPSPAAVTVSSNIDVGAITFTTGGWQLSAGSGVLARGGSGTLTITTTTGTDTINARIVDGSMFGTGGGVTSLTKSGSGTLILGAPNTYSGSTIVTAGVIQLATTSGIGTSGTLTVSGGASSAGTVDLNGHDQSVAAIAGSSGTVKSVITNTAAGTPSTLTLTGSNNTSFAGMLQDGAGTIALSKSGTGTLTLSAQNTYSGATTLNAGSIVINSTGALIGSSITVNSDGTLSVARTHGSDPTISSVSSGSVSLQGGSLAVTTDLAFNGFLSNASTGGSLLINTGATTFTAGGSNAIDFTSLPAGSSLRLGSTSTGTIASTVLLTPDSTTHTLRFSGGNGTLTVDAAVVDVGSVPTNVDLSGLAFTTLTGNSSYTGLTTLSSRAILNVNSSNALGSTVAGTVINESSRVNLNTTSAEPFSIAGGALNLKAVATGTVTLASGTVSLLAGGGIAPGALVLSGGVLSFGTDVSPANMLANGSTGGIFSIDTAAPYTAGGTNVIDFSQMPGGEGIRLGTNSGTPVSIASTVVLIPDSTSHTLRFGYSTGDTLTYNGAISDVGGVPTNVDVSGNSNGTHTILGGNSSFSGTTTINVSLTITHANALGKGTGVDADGTTINAGGTLTLAGVTLSSEKITLNGGTLNGSSNGPIFLSASSKLAGTYNGIISGGGDATFVGNSTLGVANLYTGKTILNGPSNTNNVTLTFLGDGSFGPAPSSFVPDALQINGTLLLSPTATGDVTIDPNRGILLGYTEPASGSAATIFNVGSGANLIYNGVIADGFNANGLQKVGAGTLTLGGSNTFHGMLTVSEGTVILVGPIVPLNPNSNSVVVYSSLRLMGNDRVYPGGSLLLFGKNASVDLNGFNQTVTSLGGTAPTASTLNSSPGTTSILTVSGTSKYDAQLNDGAGILALVKTVGGTLTLTNAGNTYSGGTKLLVGEVAVSSLASLGAGNVTFFGGILGFTSTPPANIDSRIANPDSFDGGFDVRSGSLIVGSNLSGPGSLTKIGNGLLALSGSNSYAGGTNVTFGTLQLASSASLASGPVTVGAGTLDLNGFSVTVTAISGASDPVPGSITNNASGTTSILTVAVTGPTWSEYENVLQDGAAGGILGLAKTSDGTLTLYKASTYSGGTIVSGGVLRIRNTAGSATGTGSVMLNGGVLAGSGTISGEVIAGSSAHTIAPSATLPSTTSTRLTLGALTTTSNTTLAFNLITPGTNDALTITSTDGLTLNGGQLQVANVPNTASSLGTYKIIQYTGAIQGTGLSSLTAPATQNNITYSLNTTTDGTNNFITLHRGYLGDANDDGTVNFADFVQLSNHYGQSDQGWSAADFNNDHTTNFADFVILSNHYGESITGQGFTATPDELAAINAFATTPTSAPEPASLALLLLAAPTLLVRRRTKRAM